MLPSDPLDDNPRDIDSRSDIRELLREDGHDPSDARSNGQLTEGWSILHDWADEEPEQRGGRTGRQLAAEAELLLDVAAERDVDLDDPLNIEGYREPDWYQGDDVREGGPF